MRLMITFETAGNAKRAMMVTNPQDKKYAGGIICYYYTGREDCPAMGGEFFDGCTVSEVIGCFSREFDFDPAGWIDIGDQLPGCRDDWVGPVRVKRNEQGKPIYGAWERLVGDQWQAFTTDYVGRIAELS